MSNYKKWESSPKIKTEGTITTCIAVPLSRYIDMEWLKQKINVVFWTEIDKIIDSAPSIDIVRCQECKHGEYREDFDDYLCDQLGLGVVNNADFFCSDGERREE